MAGELEVIKSKVNTIGAMLESRKQMIAQVLPRHIKADRLIKVALMAMNRQPELLNCTPSSLFQSLMMAGQLGLEPDGVLGSAYLIPYGTQCTLIPGYRGLIDLARRSGQIKSIEAHLIRNGDKFECAFGLDPRLSHSPVFPGDEAYLKNENIIGAYAVAKLVDGGEQFEVMSRAEIDAIRNRSKASKSGPWVTDFGEMARKTVVRRLFKYLPVSVEMASALELDNRADSGEQLVDLIDLPAEVIPQEEKKSATESLAEKTRKPRSDKGQSRIHEKEAPPPEEYQPHTKNIESPEPTPPPFSVLCDPETLDELRLYCGKLGIDADQEAGKYQGEHIKKLSMLTKEEAGVMLGHLLDQAAEKGLV